MPFASVAQREWMYANHPQMARRWQRHTPKGKKLPAHKHDKPVHNTIRRNPLRLDPSRTVLLRRAFRRALTQRFDAVRKAVWQAVAQDDMMGLAPPVANAPAFKFETDTQKLHRFNRWLKRMVDQGILVISPVTVEPVGAKPWVYKYIDSAWKKGALRAYIDSRLPELSKKQDYYEGTRAGFLESAFGRPERVDKLRLLYTRTYENLKGITQQMSSQMSRIMADGLAHGKAPRTVARDLSKAITGISRFRANTLAQTEIMHAHAEGQLDGMEDLGVEEVGAEVEFSTSGDDGVCRVCQKLEGEIYTIAKARGVIPVHPNCRCSWMPVVTPTMKKAEQSRSRRR